MGRTNTLKIHSKLQVKLKLIQTTKKILANGKKYPNLRKNIDEWWSLYANSSLSHINWVTDTGNSDKVPKKIKQPKALFLCCTQILTLTIPISMNSKQIYNIFPSIIQNHERTEKTDVENFKVNTRLIKSKMDQQNYEPGMISSAVHRLQWRD